MNISLFKKHSEDTLILAGIPKEKSIGENR